MPALPTDFGRVPAVLIKVLPELLATLKEESLSLADFLIFCGISEFGHEIDGQHALPVGSLSDWCVENGILANSSAVSRSTTRLMRGGWVNRVWLTSDQRDTFFKFSTGWNAAVSLTAQAELLLENQISQFGRTRTLLRDLMGDQARNTSTLEDPKAAERVLAALAKQIGATGIAIWLARPRHGTLHIAAAWGYSKEIMKRVWPISLAGDNAVAAAFRTEAAQFVLPTAQSRGAAAMPISTSEGPIGVLCAELPHQHQTMASEPALRAAAADLVKMVVIGKDTPAASRPQFG